MILSFIIYWPCDEVLDFTCINVARECTCNSNHRAIVCSPLLVNVTVHILKPLWLIHVPWGEEDLDPIHSITNSIVLK